MHYVGFVKFEQDTDDAPQDIVAEILEPYREIENNPSGAWDWWVIGGRWGGNIFLKRTSYRTKFNRLQGNRINRCSFAYNQDIDWSKTPKPFFILDKKKWKEEPTVAEFNAWRKKNVTDKTMFVVVDIHN